MKNTTHAVVSTVIGRFMRKIHRHESLDLDERAPPITGPIPLAIATTAPYGNPSIQDQHTHSRNLFVNSFVPTRIPWYFPRSLRGTTSLTINWATVIKPPPPIPVKARKMVSCSTDWAREEAREPMKKMASPTRRTSLRDQISERRP